VYQARAKVVLRPDYCAGAASTVARALSASRSTGLSGTESRMCSFIIIMRHLLRVCWQLIFVVCYRCRREGPLVPGSVVARLSVWRELQVGAEFHLHTYPGTYLNEEISNEATSKAMDSNQRDTIAIEQTHLGNQSSFANAASGRISFGVRRLLASLSRSTNSRSTSADGFPAPYVHQMTLAPITLDWIWNCRARTRQSFAELLHRQSRADLHQTATFLA
jgi:hypothetical protein